MFQLVKVLFFTFFLVLCHSTVAVTIYECIDEDGRKSFQDRCPPGMEIAGERNVGKKKKKLALQITLYTVPNCKACNAIRSYLEEREIEFETKNVSGSPELQNELKDIVGSLKIPTTIINDEISTGYNENELGKLLKSAGWKKLAPIDR